jgi:hypothetical protein
MNCDGEVGYAGSGLLMAGIRQDDNWDNLIWLHIEKSESWVDYNRALEDLALYAAKAQTTLYVIVQPEHDIPSGNPLPHMRRFTDIVKREGRIRKAFVVLPRTLPMATAFVRVGQRVFGFGDAIQLVASTEDALAAFREAVGHLA